MEFPRITCNPDVLDAKPCIRDSRITVATILGLFATGHSQTQILELYRGLSADDIREALLYAARRVQEPDRNEARLAVGDREQGSAVQPRASVTAKPPVRETARVEPEFPGKEDRLEFGPTGKKPWVVVTRAGLWDRRLCADLIAWGDIHEMSLYTRDRPRSVCLQLRDPERYLRAIPFKQRLGARLQMLLGDPRFFISSTDTGVSARELYVRIKRIWIVYRSDTPQLLKGFPSM